MSDNQDGLRYGLFHGIVLAITIYLTYMASPGSSLFSWHPFLMTVSMFFLMVEGILMFSPDWSLIPKKYHKKLHLDAHSYIQVMGAIAFGFGFWAIYTNKDQNGKLHFTTWHGQLGLAQIVHILGGVSLGVLIKYGRMLPFKLNISKLKTTHCVWGVVALVMVTFIMVTACFTNFFASQTYFVVPYLFSALIVAIYGFIGKHVVTTNSRITALYRKPR